ncbi:MAG TPA: hypothetical protein DCQ98_18480 [Planctomycetaceae bacterium]|nr:hypothetical protein [Planctomycetaceae bacterium]
MSPTSPAPLNAGRRIGVRATGSPSVARFGIAGGGKTWSGRLIAPACRQEVERSFRYSPASSFRSSRSRFPLL